MTMKQTRLTTNTSLGFYSIAGRLPGIPALLSAAALLAAACPVGQAADALTESARAIPIAYDVDIVVVGGSGGAVAAAVAAADKGAKVFLAAPRHYLGEDICGTLRLWLEPGEDVSDPLAARLFRRVNTAATPLQIKAALADALLKAKVDFLYGCFPSDVLTSADGSICGIVMANRAGRQAVRAKVIIDATPDAVVARLAGAKARPWPAGPVTFRRVVIGGQTTNSSDVSRRKVPVPPVGGGKSGSFDLVEYTLRLPLADDSFAALAEAEQLGRDRTSSPDDALWAENMFHVPPAALQCRKDAAAWPGLAKGELDHFRPAGIEFLFILGGCADIPRDEAERLLRPAKLIEWGTRIGAAAAEAARTRPSVGPAGLAGAAGRSGTALDTKESLTGVRPTQKLPTLQAGARALPVWGQYDVVVVGGGTAGWRAAHAAAGGGARTLVVEFLYGTGGVGTLGGISKEDIMAKMHEQRAKLRAAKVDLWFGAAGCGAVVEGDRVRGVVVATPQGRAAVLAKVVVDATGNADIAAAAGAECLYTDAGEFAVQGTGLTTINPKPGYANSDFTFTDDTDLVDVWHLLVYTKGSGYDKGQLVDTRERRRIAGDFILTILDQVTGRTFPDTIEQCNMGGFDTHGYTSDPYFFVEFLPDGAKIKNTPYRCLLPRGLDGILVTGLGLSAQRDAMPFIRWQNDMGRMGQAAGTAAAMIARAGQSTRQIDVRQLQQRLVAAGVLTENVLSEKDSFPASDEILAAAVKSVVLGLGKKYRGTAVLMAHRDRAVPLLKRAYAEATEPDDKLIYAHILGICGDATGVPTLISAVQSAAWDKGWNFRGMDQIGPSVSKLDRLVIALGFSRDPRAVPVVLEKVRQLTPKSELSHHRAVALATVALGDRAAAKPLAELLSQPEMRGYTVKTLADHKREGKRTEALRELMLARALFLLGDQDGVARKVLEDYTQDLRGHFARHATAVLAAGTGKKDH
jgi:flavin-dependent dehydrogenase